MSYEGSVEYICEDGYLMDQDCYDKPLTHCIYCSKPLIWTHSIDETNGYDPKDPTTLPAPVLQNGSIDIWRTDHYGNKYAIKIPRFEPDSPEWKRL